LIIHGFNSKEKDISFFCDSIKVIFQDNHSKNPIRIVITGAAGQIAYSLIHPICNGDVFGKDQVSFSLSQNHLNAWTFSFYLECYSSFT
jgi:hypothetical protein